MKIEKRCRENLRRGQSSGQSARHRPLPRSSAPWRDQAARPLLMTKDGQHRLQKVSDLSEASELALHTLHLLLGNLGATASSVHVVTTKGGGTEAGNEGQAGSGSHCEGVCVVGEGERGRLIIGRKILWYGRVEGNSRSQRYLFDRSRCQKPGAFSHSFDGCR